MIRITNGDRTTELAWDGAPVSVSRLLERAGLHPDRPCGGQGRCGKCRVLARGDLSPAAPEERKHLTAAEEDVYPPQRIFPTLDFWLKYRKNAFSEKASF